MPVNPNIALGVQPIQQPNMLGQMGQAMALRAAQQETEGYEGVKSALSGGMSPTDPRILQYGKRGIEAFRAAGEGRVKQIEVAKKQNEVLGSIFGGVLQDPTTGPQAVSRLVEMGVMTGEQAQRVIEQAGNNPDAWRKLAKPYYEGAIDAEKRLTAETSIKTANISAGPGYQQAALAREKFEFEKANPSYEYKTLDNGGIAAVNKRTNEVTLLQAPSASPMPAASATPPVNALAPTPAAPAANLNALINPPVVNQPGAPTIANANALAPVPLRAAPRPGYEYNAQGQQVPIMDPTKVVSTVTDAQGNVRMINAAGDVVKTAEGAGKPSPGFEKRQAEIEKLPTAITQASDTLKLIDRMVGAPGGKSKPHEGFSGAVGAGMGMRFIPGTSASDFQAMHEQVTGGAFLQAFNDLKGGGAITEKEGEKATAAITRMKLSTSEKEYIQAAREFQDVVRRGIETAQRKIKSGGAVSPANTGDIATNPSIQSLLDKYK